MADPIVIDDSGGQVKPALGLLHDAYDTLDGLINAKSDTIKRKIVTFIVYDAVAQMEVFHIGGAALASFEIKDKARETIKGTYDATPGSESLKLDSSKSLKKDNNDPTIKLYLPVQANVASVSVQLQNSPTTIAISGNVTVTIKYM